MDFQTHTTIQSHTITIVPRYAETDKGGGAGILIIYAGSYEGIFENNTIVGNISKSRTGGISSSTKNTISTIRNNIIWGNRQSSGKQVEERWGSILRMFGIPGST